LTQGEVAEQCGVSVLTVRKHVRDRGIARRYTIGPERAAMLAKMREPYDPDLLRELSEKGMTTEEIGQQIGRPTNATRKAMVRLGIPRQEAKARPRHNSFWNGGVTVDKAGYILLHMPTHPDAKKGGYVRQHRLVMSQHIGRQLLPGEVVDHENGDPSDNRIENLRLFASNADHLRATLTGVKKLPRAERDAIQQAAVQRALVRAEAIRQASGSGAGQSP
jgi:hypothetical protein